ncbi:MAG: hypothetical protein L0L12_09495 [Corynebacterium casei]|nr:hypothetical protein [Corynebacterium casei]MDN5706640.1 hypothetical protein [Corynebacterium casei]MDN5784996.1 hypothetical protein [Corynebacterium casei]MDN5800060.1 hypothetical protein [Corynebacterium casei]MDN5826698.1 hypothetical protein [Corynebacterium casei]MDN5841243.1 hypothetical protein [Corynebacterium casei]
MNDVWADNIDADSAWQVGAGSIGKGFKPAVDGRGNHRLLDWVLGEDAGNQRE